MNFSLIQKIRGQSGLILVSPPFFYALLLLAFPLMGVLALSFWTQDYLELNRGFTLDNYREAWTGAIYQALMLRSLKISILVTLLTVVLAFPVAYFISFHVPPKKKPLWIFLITIPFWTSYLIRIFLWKVILGFNGVINGSLIGIGLIDEPLKFLLFNQGAIVVTLSHAWIPFAILPIYVALEKIDRSLLEASEDLGDGPVRRFIRVTLPLAMPGIIAATLIVFIPTIGDYVTPKLVGGPNGLLIANMIEVQFKKANNAPLGAALALSAMFVVSTMAMVFLWFNRKYLKQGQ
ncbi:MAG: ABC transporter permease [Rhodobacteraceae bacterium]|nr:ABC transporter permease [Paracoccaceae bacterium]MCY4250116.1 ABC transporter permease [Paracoccaceae bacterium]